MSPSDLAEWIPVAPWLVAIVALIGLTIWLARYIVPVLRRWSRFLDDVAGEPARPGFEARPGIMERMASQEVAYEHLKDTLEHVRHEVTPNHGSSMRDVVNRLERDLGLLDARVQAHLSISTNTAVVPAPVVGVIEVEKKEKDHG